MYSRHQYKFGMYGVGLAAAQNASCKALSLKSKVS